MTDGPRMLLWWIDATAGADSAWVRLGPGGLRAKGRIAALLPRPHWVDYRLEADGDLVTRRMRAEARWSDGSAAVDVRNDDGQWTVDGVSRPDLDGARDVDVAGCPLTNVMPIRRHDLHRRPGVREFLVAFIATGSHRSLLAICHGTVTIARS